MSIYLDYNATTPLRDEVKKGAKYENRIILYNFFRCYILHKLCIPL